MDIYRVMAKKRYFHSDHKRTSFYGQKNDFCKVISKEPNLLWNGDIERAIAKNDIFKVISKYRPFGRNIEIKRVMAKRW